MKSYAFGMPMNIRVRTTWSQGRTMCNEQESNFFGDIWIFVADFEGIVEKVDFVDEVTCKRSSLEIVPRWFKLVTIDSLIDWIDEKRLLCGDEVFVAIEGWPSLEGAAARSRPRWTQNIVRAVWKHERTFAMYFAMKLALNWCCGDHWWKCWNVWDERMC